MIKITRLTKKALNFAAQKHDGQYRKFSKVPYITHPIEVAFNIASYTKDEEIVAAAFLHDILEDCPDVTFYELKKEFGIKIATLVKEVSGDNKNKEKIWKKKKGLYLSKIRKASEEALLIVAVDKMINMNLYFELLKKNKLAAEKSFKGTPEDYLWYYTSIGDILNGSFNKKSLIIKDYTKSLEDIKKAYNM